MLSIDDVMSSTRETMNLGATCWRVSSINVRRGNTGRQKRFFFNARGKEERKNVQQVPRDQSNTDIDRACHSIFEQ